MSTTPPPDPVEYLEPDGRPAAGRTPGRGRRALLGAGLVVAAGLLGGGVWAATALVQTGDQPAQALPAATLGYVAVDLDPSGAQKIEAVRTLNRFPAFADWADVGSEEDVVGRLVDLALADSDCELTYEPDVEPWLGSRFALAGVEAGAQQASPVAVVQVEDAAAAEEGVAAALAACGGDGEDEVAWSIEGDWMVVAETQEILDRVVAETDAGALADDADFRRWTGAAGGSGIVTGYAAPGAGAYLADELVRASATTDAPRPGGLPGAEQVPDAVVEALEDFEGAAVTVRFDDGSLDIETAADTTGSAVDALTGSQDGAAAVSRLPVDTVAAYGIGLTDGWGEKLIAYLRTRLGEAEAARIDQAIGQAEQRTGLSIPEDLETLLGSSLAIAVGGDLSIEGLTASQDGSDLPIGIRIEGDAAAIEGVLEDVRAALGPGAGLLLASESDDDTVAISPSSAYRGSLVDDGGLGDSDRFARVVPEADRASSVLYVDVDGLDAVISQLLASGGADASGEIARNVEPLSAVGLSLWTDDDGVGHARIRVTTDE